MANVSELFSDTIDKTLVIDSDLRTIKIPSSMTNIGVESDDKVTRLQFRMPRYYNDIDLSEFTVRVNYMNANNEPDVYAATDIVVNEESITFSWLVGRFAVKYKGDVVFIVCLKKLTNDGVVDKEFNTTTTKLPVLVGLETEQAVVECKRDALAAVAYEAILLGLDNGLKGDPGYTPVKGTDYYTSNEREEFAEEVVNAAKGVYANAYKQTVSGEVIRVDDVSPIEHTVDIRVHGKNIARHTGSSVAVDSGGIHFAKNSDGTVTATGTAISTGYYLLQQSTEYKDQLPLPKGKYILSKAPAQGCRIVAGVREDESSGRVLHSVGYIDNLVFDINTDTARFDIILCVDTGATIDGVVFKPQLEEGATATDYTPYIDPSTVTLRRSGKAVFLTKEYELAKESAAWTSILMAKIKIGPGNYVASCRFNQVGTDKSTVCMSARDYNDYSITFGSVRSEAISGTFVLPFTVEEGSDGFQLFLYSNHSENVLLTDCIFSDIMVEVGTEATGYDAYAPEAYKPNADGTVENVYSLSPTMSLFTDTNGITIDLEYSRDNNAVIGDISSALDTLIAMQKNSIELLDHMSGGAS